MGMNATMHESEYKTWPSLFIYLIRLNDIFMHERGLLLLLHYRVGVNLLLLLLSSLLLLKYYELLTLSHIYLE